MIETSIALRVDRSKGILQHGGSQKYNGLHSLVFNKHTMNLLQVGNLLNNGHVTIINRGISHKVLMVSYILQVLALTHPL